MVAGDATTLFIQHIDFRQVLGSDFPPLPPFLPLNWKVNPESNHRLRARFPFVGWQYFTLAALPVLRTLALARVDPTVHFGFRPAD